jgi:hypothetical protein
MDDSLPPGLSAERRLEIERRRRISESLAAAGRFSGAWSAVLWVAMVVAGFVGTKPVIALAAVWALGLLAAGGYVAGTRWSGQSCRTIGLEVLGAVVIGIVLLVVAVLMGGGVPG